MKMSEPIASNGKRGTRWSLAMKIESGWIKDIVFGVACYFILLSVFAGSSQWMMIDHIYTSIFLGTLIIFGTINAWIIQPRFLDRKKYVLFVLFSVINILLGAFFNHLLFDKFIDYLLPGYYFISFYAYTDLVKFFFVYIFLLTLLDLSWEWFQFQETQSRVIMLEKEKKDAELRALMNQVNPHFLFNSLTVLYSLSLKNSNDTPGAIIKLSDILRYVIYESGTEKVSLASEIMLIRNYLDLQQYRTDPSARINFTVDADNQNIFIEPMIFLPLIENSFKHGVKSETSDRFIDILLRAKDGVVTFSITNNKSEIPSNERSPGGIGLKNIESRLHLIYKGRHSFVVEDTQKLFSVHLKLKLAE
jgi:hypothetical protein